VREIRDILGAFQNLRKSGEAGVLASAVHTEGSTYRRSGARMLMLPDEQTIGLISGGCLEGDLLEHARSVRESGEPRIVRYDMRPEEEIQAVLAGRSGGWLCVRQGPIHDQGA